jgi:putative hydrolase of the HAD superfamily
MPAIQVVLFDLGGTLLHYEQPPEYSFDRLNALGLRAMFEVAARAGVKVRDPELAIRAVARMAAAMEARARRARYANSAETIIRDGLEAVGIRLPPEVWEAGMAAYYNTISSVVKPVDGNPRQVLACLAAQGRAMGLVSNTFWSPALHDADLERFGLLEYLPVRIYSCVAGIVKPHPNIYRQALDALDVAPPEAVFVGDKLDVDVAGPQKVGMRAVLVASPYRAEEDPEIVPDARIQSLAELPALLEEWDRALELAPGQQEAAG